MGLVDLAMEEGREWWREWGDASFHSSSDDPKLICRTDGQYQLSHICMPRTARTRFAHVMIWKVFE